MGKTLLYPIVLKKSWLIETLKFQEGDVIRLLGIVFLIILLLLDMKEALQKLSRVVFSYGILIRL